MEEPHIIHYSEMAPLLVSCILKVKISHFLLCYKFVVVVNKRNQLQTVYKPFQLADSKEI